LKSFGGIKTIAELERRRVRGLERVGWACPSAAAAYNLVRLLMARRDDRGLSRAGETSLYQPVP
jgi:hypothetical protein